MVNIEPSFEKQVAVWSAKGGRTSEPHSEEVFISIKLLREAIGPTFSLATDRRLFGYPVARAR